MSWHRIMALPALCIPMVLHAWGSHAAKPETAAGEVLLKEWQAVQRSNYEVLERMPVRHWGRDGLQEPLRRIDRMLLGDKGNLQDNARRQAEAAYERMLEALMIRPAAAISLDVHETPQVQPPVVELDLHRNVPSALVFRVNPSGRETKLRVTAAEHESITIEPQEIAVSATFPTFVVVPIVARGPAGIHSVSLRIAATNKRADVTLRVNVGPSGSLKVVLTRRRDRAPIAAKLYIEDNHGRLYVIPGEPNYRTQSWYAFFQPRFSYVEGKATVPLPPGEYHVTAMKGYG